MDIVHKCHATDVTNRSEMHRIYQNHEKKRIHDSQTWFVQSKFSQLEGIAPEVLGHILDYKENILNEEEQEAKEVTIEFKKDTLDPSRPIVQWERTLNVKKRNELNRKTRMINKGKDM